MRDAPCVLVIDDDRSIRDGLASALDEAGYRVRTADGVVTGRAAVARGGVDAALLDIRLRDGDGLDLLAELRRDAPSVPVIMATAYGDSDRTIMAMKLGAFDYVTKPFDLDALLATVARATSAPAAARVERGPDETAFVGASLAMLDVWKAIGRAAASSAPVLITGESGVGKDLVARTIHAHSARRDAPFVPVNVAALAPTLVESELFGHERGAFTGAATAREGRFELASSGTLFLDEIGDLEPAMQTRLLRVLEDGGYERVGGNTRLVSRARIVSATSRPVTPGAPSTTLREDLFYRLSVVRIEVPPLRRRRVDIPLLIDAALRRAGGARRAISEAAMRALTEYDWPGNVRQLLHVVESACVMSAAEVLDVRDFAISGAPTGDVANLPDDGDLDLRRNLEALERRLILRAIERAQGNRAQAARLLGIRRALLYARARRFGLFDDDET
jgi:two-component system, NtrC family, response regulator AtoC